MAMTLIMICMRDILPLFEDFFHMVSVMAQICTISLKYLLSYFTKDGALLKQWCGFPTIHIFIFLKVRSIDLLKFKNLNLQSPKLLTQDPLIRGDLCSAYAFALIVDKTLARYFSYMQNVQGGISILLAQNECQILYCFPIKLTYINHPPWSLVDR